MKTIPPLSRRLRGAHKLAALLSLASLLAAAPLAVAATPTVAELMELGVYSEETKGDIDAAVLLYQQVIADTATNQSLAAQAQFRLGLCYDKKRDFAAATAAFEKLIRDYPKENDLVAAASDYLADGAALLPAPWQDGETLDFDMKVPSGFKVGVARYSVTAGAIEGRKTWRFRSQVIAGSYSWSQTDVDAGSMKPIHGIWNVRPIVLAVTTYSNGRAEVKIRGAEPKTVDLNGIVYDNEEAMQLIRRLPLAPGYSKTISVLSSIGGGQITPVQLKVVGTDKVLTPLGAFDCHKITATLISGTQTYWYTTDAHRYLVKCEAGGAVAELVSIKQGGPDLPVSFVDPALGFSITAPANWIIRGEADPANVNRPTVLIADAEGISMTKLKVQPQKNFDAAAMTSPRAFAEYKNGMDKIPPAIRADSWSETTMAGQPAVSFIADRTSQIKLAVLSTYAFVDGNVVDFTCTLPAEELEAVRPKYEALVASYRGK